MKTVATPQHLLRRVECTNGKKVAKVGTLCSKFRKPPNFLKLPFHQFWSEKTDPNVKTYRNSSS